jgi:hypothetical protein
MRKILTPALKREILEYRLHYSKDLIEDIDELGEAYMQEDGREVINEIYDFFDDCMQVIENSHLMEENK